MYRLHGFFTQNSMKTLYVLEELGVDYEYVYVDLAKGENRTEQFRRMTPAGKVPVLEHDGEFLFESAAMSPVRSIRRCFPRTSFSAPAWTSG